MKQITDWNQKPVPLIQGIESGNASLNYSSGNSGVSRSREGGGDWDED